MSRRSDVDVSLCIERRGIPLANRLHDPLHEFIHLLGCAARQIRSVQDGPNVDLFKRWVLGQSLQQIVGLTLIFDTVSGRLTVLTY